MTPLVMNPLARVLVCLFALLALPVPAAAQDPTSTPAPVRARRRVRPPAWTPPATPVLAPLGGHRVALGLVASGPVELVTDVRLFSLEVTERVTPPEPGSRRRARRPRTHRCRLSDRVGRRETLAQEAMRAGDAWGVSLDIRALCWGRALSALEGGGSVVVRYEAARARGAFVARGPGGETTRTMTAASTFTLPAPAEPAAPVSLTPVDARSGRFSLRVAIYGPEAATRRVWITPDRVSFRVVDPAGGTWVCALPSAHGAAIPDLFQRFSARRAVRYTLDAAQYCPAEVFERTGIYEVTPLVELDEDGSAWRLNAVTGRWAGAPAAVRFHAGEGTFYTPLAAGEAARALR